MGHRRDPSSIEVWTERQRDAEVRVTPVALARGLGRGVP